MNHPLTNTVSRIRTAGNRPVVSLQQLDEHLSQFKGSQQLFQRMNDAVPAVAIHSDGKNRLPHGKDSAVREVPDNAGHRVQQLADRFRVVTSGGDMKAGEFQACLQVLDANTWWNVAAYEYFNGRARRYMFYSNGERTPFQMDLPSPVVYEMAREDFQRNWTVYYREFLGKPANKAVFPS